MRSEGAEVRRKRVRGKEEVSERGRGYKRVRVQEEERKTEDCVVDSLFRSLVDCFSRQLPNFIPHFGHEVASDGTFVPQFSQKNLSA